jgi:hypothetical protein
VLIPNPLPLNRQGVFFCPNFDTEVCSTVPRGC